MYLKNSTWPPWYDEIAMPCASSWIAQLTISSTDAVVAEVDHLAAGRLQDAPHDVDRRVVAVEQRGRGDEADLVDRLVDERRTARVVHGGLLRTRPARGAANGKAYPSMPRSSPDRSPYITFT